MSVKRLQVGPRLSQAVVHGNTVYLAGIVAGDEPTIGGSKRWWGDRMRAMDRKPGAMVGAHKPTMCVRAISGTNTACANAADRSDYTDASTASIVISTG